MHSAKANGNNVSIMTPSKEDKDDKGTQQSSEKNPVDAAALTKDDTNKEEAVAAAAAVDLPPDLKEAKNSPSRVGSVPQEVADLLFSAAPPANKAEKEKTIEATVESKGEAENESKSTPNTPLRGSSSKEFTLVKKKKRSWLSLSPSRRRMKEQAHEEAENMAANNETVAADTIEVEKDDAQEMAESRETKVNTTATAQKEVDTSPEQVEAVTTEAVVKGTEEGVTKRQGKQDDYELITVGEGVEGVREAERRNYARATSNADLSDYENVPTETKEEEMDLSTYSPESKPEEGKENANEETSDEKEENLADGTATAEEAEQEKVPTIPKSKKKKKKKWFKPPKINLSFNKKRAQKKMESEELLSGEPKEIKEEEKKEPEVESEELEVAPKEVVTAAEMGVDSSREISHKDKTTAEPQVTDTPKINNFLRLGVMFVILGILAASILDPEFACTPAPRGIVLDKITLKQYTSEAPWWVPASFKSKGLFQLVCGDRPRTKLEWTFQKQNKDTKLHQLVISDQDCSDPKKATLLNRKNLVSATVGLSEITVVNKKGKEEVLSAPWKHYLSHTVCD